MEILSVSWLEQDCVASFKSNANKLRKQGEQSKCETLPHSAERTLTKIWMTIDEVVGLVKELQPMTPQVRLSSSQMQAQTSMTAVTTRAESTIG